MNLKLRHALRTGAICKLLPSLIDSLVTTPIVLQTIGRRVLCVKPGFHISQFIGDLLSGIAEENDFRNTKDFIHR